MLYIEDFEEMQCANPECDHTGHTTGLYIHQRCHFGVGVRAAVSPDGSVAIRCPVCGLVICHVAAEPVNIMNAPPCHPDYNFDAKYHDGVIDLECCKCSKHAQIIVVKAKPATT